MAQDTNIFLRVNGMEGGSQNMYGTMMEDDNDLAVHQRETSWSPYRNAGPMVAHRWAVANPQDVFANVSVKQKEGAINDASPHMDSLLGHMEDQSPVVNLKKKQAKKVLEPESPQVVSVLSPPPFSESSVKRKRQEDVMMKSIECRPEVMDNVEGLILKINGQSKGGQPMNSVGGIVIDKKEFSGNFNPKATSLVAVAAKCVVEVFKDETTKKDLVKKTINDGKLQRNEVIVPMKMESKNIAKVFGLHFDGTNAILVMEYAGKSLRQWVKEPKGWNNLKQPVVMEKVVSDMLVALTQLAAKNIAHRDLKPENVCVDYVSGKIVAKLIDFESSQDPNDSPLSYRGITPEYLDIAFNSFYFKVMKTRKLPPNPRQILPKDDVWALGLIMLFVKMGGHPMIMHHINEVDYPATDDPHKLDEMRTYVIEKISQMTSLPAEFTSYPDSRMLEKIMRMALTLNRDERPSASELMAVLSVPEPTRKKMKMEVDEPWTMEDLSPASGGLLKLKGSFSGQRVVPQFPDQADYNHQTVDKKMKRASLVQGGSRMVPREEGDVEEDPIGLVTGIGGIDLRCKQAASPPPVGFNQGHMIPTGHGKAILLKTKVEPEATAKTFGKGKVEPAGTQLQVTHGLENVICMRKAPIPVQKIHPRDAQTREQPGNEDGVDLVNFFLNMEKSVLKTKGFGADMATTVQAGASRVATVQAGASRVATVQAGASRAATVKTGASRIATVQAGASRVAAVQAGASRVATVQVSRVATVQAGPSRVATVQAGVSWVAPVQAGADRIATVQEKALPGNWSAGVQQRSSKSPPAQAYCNIQPKSALGGTFGKQGLFSGQPITDPTLYCFGKGTKGPGFNFKANSTKQVTNAAIPVASGPPNVPDFELLF